MSALLGALLALLALGPSARAQDDGAGDDMLPLDEEEAAPAPDEGHAQEEPGPDEESEPPAPDEDEPAPAPPEEEQEEEAAPDGADLPPVGTTLTFDGADRREEDGSRLLIPPLLLEDRGGVTTRAFFPFYYHRLAPGDEQLLVGPYYQRRGTHHRADVVFPFYWSFRGDDYDTWAIPPVYHSRSRDGYDWGAFPFVFSGRDGNDSYTVIPPLLLASWRDEASAHTFAGPYWRIRDNDTVDWGVFPLVWAHDGPIEDRFLSPLYLRLADNEEGTETHVVPPLLSFHRSTPTGASWMATPLLHHSHDADSTSWTFAGIFHYSRGEDAFRLVVPPLFGYFDVEGDETLITPLYQRHRGDTELDAVAPFFFSWRDPRDERSALAILPPLGWHFESPASSATIVAPLFAHFHEVGHYTTWLTPLFGHYQSHRSDTAGTWVGPLQVSHTPTSNTFNIHPLVYNTVSARSRHFVLAPIVWNFENEATNSAATVIFPLFWRFRSGAEVSQLVLPNVYYHANRRRGVRSWEVHVFPFFSYGESGDDDHWWNVLLGLVGYERRGAHAEAQLFWVPFQVDGPDASAPRRPSVAARARPRRPSN